MQVLIQRLKNYGRDTPLPSYMTILSSGLDLIAALDVPLTIFPNDIVLIPSGLMVAIPEGFEGQIRARSGLAVNCGITVLNAPGTIDADYRGEIKIILINLGIRPVVIVHGERVAQLVVAPIVYVDWVDVEVLPSTLRGKGGLGHTG